jgi:hypothetical protein
MSISPPRRSSYFRTWLVAVGFANLFGWLIIYWEKVEANVPRMWNLTAQLWRASPPVPVPQAVVEAPKAAPPPKPSVPPLRNSDDMRDMLRALGGNKWEQHFNAHFKNRETAMVLVFTEVVDGRLKFEGDHTAENWRPTYYVTPRNRADLKKFKQGTRLLIEGDLDRYTDTGPGKPDEVTILRARVTEAKELDPTVTGSIKK